MIVHLNINRQRLIYWHVRTQSKVSLLCFVLLLLVLDYSNTELESLGRDLCVCFKSVFFKHVKVSSSLQEKVCTLSIS